jgi:hypothetical protein
MLRAARWIAGVWRKVSGLGVRGTRDDARRRESSIMSAGFVGRVVLVVPLLAGSAWAGSLRPREDDAAREKKALYVDAPVFESLPAEYCFTSGDAFGPDYLKFCVSPRGHITHFESPKGLTHLAGREGYVLCADEDRFVGVGFDAGIAEAGWGDPAVSQPGGAGTLPLVVTRTSLDGRVQLRQTFTRNAAERGVDVKMEVKNLSGATLPRVLLDRYFDADIAGTASDDFWDRSNTEAVWATDRPQGNMLLLTSAPLKFGEVMGTAETFGDWSPFGSRQSARGCVPYVTIYSKFDGVGRMERDLGAIASGATKSVTFRYRRF